MVPQLRMSYHVKYGIYHPSYFAASKSSISICRLMIQKIIPWWSKWHVIWSINSTIRTIQTYRLMITITIRTGIRRSYCICYQHSWIKINFMNTIPNHIKDLQWSPSTYYIPLRMTKILKWPPRIFWIWLRHTIPYSRITSVASYPSGDNPPMSVSHKVGREMGNINVWRYKLGIKMCFPKLVKPNASWQLKVLTESTRF